MDHWRCEICGETNPVGLEQCDGCGHPAPWPDADDDDDTDDEAD